MFVRIARAWARERVHVKGWLGWCVHRLAVVGAVVMGLGTSPAFLGAMAAQPDATLPAIKQGGGSIPGVPGEGGGEKGVPCVDPFAQVLVQESDRTTVSAVLERAQSGGIRSIDEALALVPAPFRESLLSDYLAPWRFDQALFGERGLTMHAAPGYLVSSSVAVGARGATATNSHLATMSIVWDAVEEIDINSVLTEGGRQDLLLPTGVRVLRVQGRATRGNRSAEFRGVVIDMPHAQGSVRVLVVEDDRVCGEASERWQNAYVPQPSPPCEIEEVDIPGLEHPIQIPIPLVPCADNPCWDAECIAEVNQAYRDRMTTLLALLSEGVQSVYDHYNEILRIARRTITLVRVINYALLARAFYTCLVWLPITGPEGYLLCVATALALSLITGALIRLEQRILWKIIQLERERIINQAILWIQWLIYDAYQQYLRDIAHCWLCEGEPDWDGLPCMPGQIPQPPWWPLTPTLPCPIDFDPRPQGPLIPSPTPQPGGNEVLPW